MDENQNNEDFYVLRENSLEKFVWKTVHMIDRVKMN